MSQDVYNSFDVAYDSYLEPDVDPFVQQIINSTAITSINGITGPTVTFTGGSSGFNFVPGGTTLTLVSPLTTKGDLYTWSTTGTRLASSAVNGDVLTVDTSAATGLKWAAISSTGTVTHTGALTANFMVKGNGAADITISTVLYDDGTKIGIGTTSPASKLSVAGVAATAARLIDLTGTTDKFMYQSFTNTSGQLWLGLEGTSAGQIFANSLAYSSLIGSANATAFHLGSNGSVRMTFLSGGNAGIGTNAPATSALLELSSTTGALLLTRMTTTQRNALTPVNGMEVYNSTTNLFQAYQNSAWVDMIGSGGGLTSIAIGQVQMIRQTNYSM